MNYGQMKLGKAPPVIDQRTLKLASYLDMPKLPPLPVEGSNWFKKVSKFNMGFNDQIGDCVVAGAAHMIQTWTANAGRREDITPDVDIKRTYFDLTDGVDSGLNMLAFLKYWRKVGIFDGHKIGAFVSVDPKSTLMLQYANYLFGGVYLGLNLPLSAQKQKTWTVPATLTGKGRPGSWGGHCVNAGVMDSLFVGLGTWGTVQQASMKFINIYADEAYAILTLEWFTTTHKSPPGFAWRDLLADLQRITG